MTSTLIRKITPSDPEEAILAEAGACLRAGGLVAFPTETVYGLGANALDAAAVAKIFGVKDRPEQNPLIVHIADRADLSRVVSQWPDTAQRLAAQFWPGPLTLVLPKRPEIPGIVTAGGPTVAVRMPVHAVALGLIRAAGLPLAAPSANRSGELSPTTAEHVRRALDGRIDMILDGGPTNVGLESTVLDLTVSPPRLLRPGHITPAQIEAVVGPIERTATATPSSAAIPRSPGLLPKHYSPRTPMECLVRSQVRVAALARQGLHVGWLAFEDMAEPMPEADTRVRMPPNPADYAARLYAELHRLDSLGLDRIIVEMPPETEAWLAVRDRLRRAAASG